MRARIAELVRALRRADLAVSVSEAMDAAEAAAVAGVERAVLCDALAAALIKDERDRSVFLAAFAATFPLREPGEPRSRRKRGRGASGGGGEAGGEGRAAGGETGAGGGGQGSSGTAASASGSERAGPATPSSGAAMREAEPRTGASAVPLREADTAPARAASGARRGHTQDDDGRQASGVGAAGGRARTLARLPFRDMTAADVEEAAALARALATRVRARFRRRLAPRKVGRLDFRRTLRAAVPHGGVPFERRFRGRRRDAPDLVALVDLSASAAVASEFFLSLLAPAADHFRRTHLFGFVDRLVEIEFVAGQVRPAGAIDLMARSDFGRVLKDLVGTHGSLLGADTVLLVLGDARNNRRPPRADLLAAARARVRRLVWLNPETPARWDSGDSVIAAYARHADAVVACGTLAELERALAAVARL